MTEGKARFYAYPAKVVSRGLPVFYNPAMEINRDITILLLNSLPEKNIRACDLLAGTGIRTLRMVLELHANKLECLVSNDSNPMFPALLKKNMGLNNSKKRSGSQEKWNKLIIKNKDASMLLLESSGFDYIDIDPFGSPNPFLDAACRRLGRAGILAVTATDTSALCGSFPKACRRKYGAYPRHDYLMHEAGLRILIRKIQMVAAQYEKALEPVYCYSHEHHMRVFFRAKKQKTAVDFIISKHEVWDGAGPLWTGRLWDPSLAKMMDKGVSTFPVSASMVNVIAEESQVDALGFVDVHEVGKALHLPVLPRSVDVIKVVKEAGFKAERTHFSGSGIRTTMPFDDVNGIIKRLAGK